MKITALDVYRYSLPLVQPLQFKGHVLREREGLLLKLTADDGSVGWGEAAPLPGFSGESLGEAAECIAGSRARIVGHAWDEVSVDAPWPEEWIAEWPPSVRFGADLAMLNLIAAQRGTTLCRLWNPQAADRVALNGLLSAGTENLEHDLERIRRIGFRAVKVKVGRRPVADDAAVVRAVRDALGVDVELRLDANRAWTWDDAVRFATAVQDAGIAYIEEPLKQNSRLPEFAAKTGLPVALDETLEDTPSAVWTSFAGVKAVVIKPALLGLTRSVRLARRMADKNVLTVVSSAFESGVGMMALAHWAAAFCGADLAVGLDTYRWLGRDVLEPRLDMERTPVDVTGFTWHRYAVNHSSLHDVRHG